MMPPEILQTYTRWQWQYCRWWLDYGCWMIPDRQPDSPADCSIEHPAPVALKLLTNNDES